MIQGYERPKRARYIKNKAELLSINVENLRIREATKTKLLGGSQRRVFNDWVRM